MCEREREREEVVKGKEQGSKELSWKLQGGRSANVELGAKPWPKQAESLRGTRGPYLGYLLCFLPTPPLVPGSTPPGLGATAEGGFRAGLPLA